MATKWKYATIPAAQRLKMLKEGNDELYAEEIARTKDAISNRLAAGLDVSEQMKWADTVSYNHNLKKAKDMGLSEESVAKDGYANKLFADMTESGKKGVSTVNAPKAIYEKNYKNDYDTMTSDEVARSVTDSYIRGINERASALSSQYNDYAAKLDKEYEKRIREAYKKYNENEKLYEEQRLNGGYSENGGRTLTEKTKARQQLYEYINKLYDEKNDLKEKAKNDLAATLYDMSSKAMGDISDEYYRYNSLLRGQKDAEYEKSRDGIEDDKWWREYELGKSKAESESELARQKEENDKELAEKELAFKQSESAKDYEMWLAKFEADKEAEKARLEADIESDRNKNALDREKFEYEKSKDDDGKKEAYENSDNASDAPKGQKFGEYYVTCLNLAKRMAKVLVYDNVTKSYLPKYGKDELLSWILSFELSSEEKKKICSSIGIKYEE